MTPEEQDKYDFRWIIGPGNRRTTLVFSKDTAALAQMVISNRLLKSMSVIPYVEPYPTATVTNNIDLLKNRGRVIPPISDRKINLHL